MLGVLLPVDLRNRFTTILDIEGRSKREVLEAFVKEYISQYEKNSTQA